MAKVVTHKLEALLGENIVEVTPISGGDINDARLISTQNGQNFFVKVNQGSQAYAMLSAEYKGLKTLQSLVPEELTIPKVLSCEKAGDTAFLLMEYFPAQRPLSGFWTAFGRGLAKLHQTTQDYFGLDYDNFIGRLPQANRRQEDWPDFYATQRLLPQAKMAYKQQLLDLKDMQRLERLCKQLGSIYPTESPALIHGDLWNGNYLVHQNGQAILIDPAIAYSHREMDLAMSKLFGGFPQEFYTAYQNHYPLTPAWEDRLPYGQLYYLLVHLNLFGTSYLPSIKRIIKIF